MKQLFALMALCICVLATTGAFFAQARTNPVVNSTLASTSLNTAPQLAFSREDLAGVAGATGIVAGDFNGDGKADLAVFGTNGLTILIGNGDGTFHALPTMNFEATHVAFEAADMNGDGMLDLVGVAQIGAETS